MQLHISATRVFALLVAATAALAACSPDEGEIDWIRRPLGAICQVTVTGVGTKQVETDYVPHVVACENGGADTEALKAQAVAARTYMYYRVLNSGSICDSTACQVYTCSNKPQQKHYDAAKATAGQVLVWGGVVICAFYVAGAKPSTGDCKALSSDPDSTNSEKYVTCNAGKSGSGITQTTLGWVSPSNKYNRGCNSQNGANCLSLKGKSYPQILRFYYGDDIQLVTATGSCVTPAADAGPPPPDAFAPKLDAPAPELDQGLPGSDRGQVGDGLPPHPGDGLPPVQPPPQNPSNLGGGCSVLASGDVRPSIQLVLAVLALMGLSLRRRRP